MTKPKIAVAIPHLNQIDTDLAVWLYRHKNEIEELLVHRAKPIDFNRNLIAKLFLETECDVLFSVDADVTPPDNWLGMYDPDVHLKSAHVTAWQADQSIAVGFWRSKAGPHSFNRVKPREGNLYKVDAIGTGCYYVTRELLEKMQKPWFEHVYSKDGLEKYYGEDVNFSLKAGELGYDIIYDARFMAKHRVPIKIY